MHLACAQVRAGAAPAGVFLFGEEAAAFLHELRSAFAQPPTYLRRAMRRSEDWWHARTEPPLAASVSLPQLLRELDLAVTGGDFGVQHHVVSPGDPGEVQFRPATFKYASGPSCLRCSADSARAYMFVAFLRCGRSAEAFITQLCSAPARFLGAQLSRPKSRS